MSSPRHRRRLRPPYEPLDEEERSLAKRVGERLRAELEQCLRALPVPLRGGAAMARELEVDRSTCQRVLQAARASGDGLEVLLQVPGTGGLSQFLEALRRYRGQPKGFRGADEAVASLAKLVQQVGGSQTTLTKRIRAIGAQGHSALTDETQRALREQAFEALSALTGGHIETQSNFLLLRPDPADAKRAQVIGARDMVGLQGRAGAPPVSGLFFARAHESLPEGQPRPVPFDPAETDAAEEGSTLLPEFCSDPLPEVVTRRVGDVSLELIEPPGETAPAIDVSLAYRLEPAILHPALQENRRLHLYYHCMIPTRRVLLHAYLHRDMARHCLTEAAVHQRSAELLSEEPDPWFDQLDQHLLIEILGSDLAATGLGASPRQQAVAARLFDLAGWSPQDFVGFRMVVDHPLWSCRYTMGFEFGAWEGSSGVSA